MPTLNQTIDKGSMTVSAIIADFRDERFFVDESFQRRLVWTEKQRVRLIETVLMGYPIPEIYLHRQSPDDDAEGLTRHSIVDGQQRIKCLSQFMANEFPIHRKHLDEINQQSEFSDKRWEDLSKEHRDAIREYSIQHRTIPSDVSLEDIRVVFKRLNETDKSLNPQEIRHAEFDGEFIKAAEDLANLPIWRKYEVFNDNNIRRMADVEFTTSLLTVLRQGLVTDTTKAVNMMYDLFNDQYEDAAKDRSEVEKRLDFIEQVFSHEDTVSNFFSKPVHLFTVFHLVPEVMGAMTAEDLASRLRDFVGLYEAQDEGGIFDEYRSGAIQRTRSKTSRELRSNALRKFLI